MSRSPHPRRDIISAVQAYVRHLGAFVQREGVYPLSYILIPITLVFAFGDQTPQAGTARLASGARFSRSPTTDVMQSGNVLSDALYVQGTGCTTDTLNELKISLSFLRYVERARRDQCERGVLFKAS